jgi:chromosome partitioning protein
LATVAFISPKGGAGKTTAALLLALGLNERGRKVAIIDSDPNKPLVHWAEMPGKPQGISIHPAPSMHDVPAALREARRKEPDWVILHRGLDPRRLGLHGPAPGYGHHAPGRFAA